MSVFSDDEVQRMHETALRTLEELGMRVLLPEAVDMYRKGGARVDGDMVYIGRDMVAAAVASAPKSITCRAGTRDRDVVLEPGSLVFQAGAGALKADRLLLLTDVAGVKNKAGDVLTEIDPAIVPGLIEDGTIAGGMIPKIETALAAMSEGVRAVVILDGRAPNACLLELYTEHGAGSLIRTPR